LNNALLVLEVKYGVYPQILGEKSFVDGISLVLVIKLGILKKDFWVIF